MKRHIRKFPKIRKQRKRLASSHSGRRLPSMLVTFVLLLVILITIALTFKITDFFAQAASGSPSKGSVVESTSQKIPVNTSQSTSTKVKQILPNIPVIIKDMTKSIISGISNPNFKSPGGVNPPTAPLNATGATPNAPLCPDSGSAHNNNVFHTLWDATRRCHYDHEHGQSPLVAGVATTFPGFNVLQLTGGVSVGHTNLSSGMENTHKHGGFKWQFMPTHTQGCTGFESTTNGVNGSLVQTHGFGDYSVELQGRIHSSLALLRMCNQTNPTDYGYLYTVQFQDYGQIVTPYQGDTIPFPFTPNPAYDPARGPYLTLDCVGQKGIGERGACRTSREQVLNGRFNANSNWSSKPTGRENVTNPFGSTLYNLFFRVRDTYQLLDWSDKTYPFTFRFLCSSDGGVTYDPRGCRYNNSTVQVHEIAGNIPTSWDNMSGFDSDSRVGRITATGFTDRFGTLNRSCTSPSVGATRSTDCFPIKMVGAFVGTYGSLLGGKGTNVPLMPKNDIFFCNGVECRETDAGAVPSGWIGKNN